MGGLVIHHHEIRDLFHDLFSLVWSCTVKEPVIWDGSLSDPQCETLIAEFSAKGVWQPQATALFDVHVINTDAPSYINKTPDTVLKNAEKEKKMKYGCACKDRHASVTPLCISIDGLIGKEMESFDQHLAESLATNHTTLGKSQTVLLTDSCCVLEDLVINGGGSDQELPTAEVKRTMLVVAVKKATTKRVVEIWDSTMQVW
uniref:Uncharacterized protein n=1 Tax=Amphimedon queenslandica TaxID=400682 RepID=A0A1X7V366_AMPQE